MSSPSGGGGTLGRHAVPVCRAVRSVPVCSRHAPTHCPDSTHQACMERAVYNVLEREPGKLPARPPSRPAAFAPDWCPPSAVDRPQIPCHLRCRPGAHTLPAVAAPHEAGCRLKWGSIRQGQHAATAVAAAGGQEAAVRWAAASKLAASSAAPCRLDCVSASCCSHELDCCAASGGDPREGASQRERGEALHTACPLQPLRQRAPALAAARAGPPIAALHSSPPAAPPARAADRPTDLPAPSLAPLQVIAPPERFIPVHDEDLVKYFQGEQRQRERAAGEAAIRSAPRRRNRPPPLPAALHAPLTPVARLPPVPPPARRAWRRARGRRGGAAAADRRRVQRRLQQLAQAR